MGDKAKPPATLPPDFDFESGGAPSQLPGDFNFTPSVKPDLDLARRNIASPAGGANYPQPSGFQSAMAKIGNAVPSLTGYFGQEAAKGGQAISDQTYLPNVVKQLQQYGNNVAQSYDKGGVLSGLGATLQGVNPANVIDTSSPGKTLGNITVAGLLAKGMPEGAKMKAELNPEFAADRLTNVTGVAPPGKPSTVSMIRSALPEIIDTIKTTGVKDWPTAIQNTLGKLETRYQGYLEPIKNQTVSGEVIAKAIEDKITPDMPDNLQAAIRSEANQYRTKIKGGSVDSGGGLEQAYSPKEFTLEDLDNIRKRLNADNSAYHGKQEIAQGVARHQGQAGSIADLTAEKAARDALYQNIENHWGNVADIRSLKNTQGDLMQLQQRATNRSGSVEDIAASQRGMTMPQKLQNMIRGYLGTRSAGMHVAAGEVVPASATDLRSIQTAGRKVFKLKTTAFPDTAVSSALTSGLRQTTPDKSQ